MRIIAVRKAEEKKMLMQRMEEYKKKKCKTGQHEKMAILTHLAAFCLAGLSACPGRLGHPLVDSVPTSY